MKKIIQILIAYTIFIFLCSIALSFAWRNIPYLIEGTEKTYRLARAVFYFLVLLPSILLSGFSVSCAVAWRRGTENSRRRFSSAMLSRYRVVMIISIALMFILMINAEVLKPIAKDRLTALENYPEELRTSLNTANFYLNEVKISDSPYEDAQLAVQYANRAFAIAPKNDAAILTLKNANDALEAEKGKRIAHSDLESEESFSSVEDEMPLSKLDHSYTIKELVNKSRECASKEEWFESHYWATLATDACKREGLNLEEAVSLANSAWEHLKEPSGEDSEEEYKYYNNKKTAYNNYMAGEFLESYYGFKELSKVPRRRMDPEVSHFLSLSEEALKNQYFFIDETDNMSKRENSRDIYFSLKKPDGTTDVFYIKGAMDIKETGGDVRYLDALTIVTYSKEGKFCRKMFAPFAKVVSQPVSTIPQDSLNELGIDKKWKNIPFVMLQAVDRDDKTKVSKPSYTYMESGIPASLASAAKISSFEQQNYEDTKFLLPPEDAKTILLPMPYSDFSVIKDASAGADRMNILSLYSFLKSAAGYGFSTEVFLKNLVCRAIYPILLLIMFIFAACLGWNYRIEPNIEHFKFKWIFLIPLYGVFIFIFLELTQYAFDTLNYVIVGMFGSAGLFVAMIIYVIVLAIMSLIFMSRKE